MMMSSISFAIMLLSMLLCFWMTTFVSSSSIECRTNGDISKEISSRMLSQQDVGSRNMKEYSTLELKKKLSPDDGVLLFEKKLYEFAIVSDLDKKSRDPKEFLWKSYLKRGRLIWMKKTGKYRVEFFDEVELTSATSRNNRSMELSELVLYNDRLLAMCDYTGLIYKLVDIDTDSPMVLQRWAIADGNGEKVKPFKIEWATVKDDVLVVGSIGKEWVTEEGTILHRDGEWIKVIDGYGHVHNINWGNVYQALRYATNTTEPGYLWHESVHWDPRTRTWYFLPRKASVDELYSPTADETRGTNFFIEASEFFETINVSRIGPLEKDRGFTALRKVPGTADRFIALKVLEIGDDTRTWITVFDKAGNILLEPEFQLVSDKHKYEGLEFL